ncbi:MAG: hypothetical protein R3E95_19695 [Thiolinea sp.]
MIDTSTLISAFFFPQSVPAQALLKGLREYVLWVSVETQQELLEVAQRDKFDRYVPLQTRMERVTDFFWRKPVCVPMCRSLKRVAVIPKTSNF